MHSGIVTDFRQGGTIDEHDELVVRPRFCERLDHLSGEPAKPPSVCQASPVDPDPHASPPGRTAKDHRAVSERQAHADRASSTPAVRSSTLAPMIRFAHATRDVEPESAPRRVRPATRAPRDFASNPSEPAANFLGQGSVGHSTYDARCGLDNPALLPAYRPVPPSRYADPPERSAPARTPPSSPGSQPPPRRPEHAGDLATRHAMISDSSSRCCKTSKHVTTSKLRSSNGSSERRSLRSTSIPRWRPMSQPESRRGPVQARPRGRGSRSPARRINDKPGPASRHREPRDRDDPGSPRPASSTPGRHIELRTTNDRPRPSPTARSSQVRQSSWRSALAAKVEDRSRVRTSFSPIPPGRGPGGEGRGTTTGPRNWPVFEAHPT